MTKKNLFSVPAEYVSPDFCVLTPYSDGVICDSLISGDGDISGVTSDDWGEF